MIFLSILAKTLALALAPIHPWCALGLWTVSAAMDVRVLTTSPAADNRTKAIGMLAMLHLTALVIGCAAAFACDYAAMRWKDGIPIFADMINFLLGLTGMSSGSNDGLIHLTTMAGPLQFAASMDDLCLKVPALLLVMCGVWLLWSGTMVREVLRRLGMIAGVLLGVAMIRLLLVILLTNSLCQLIGYESEELPYRPFMDEAARIWIYLPLLLAAGWIINQWLPAPQTCDAKPCGLPRLVRWAALPVMLALALATFWQPAGTKKSGRLVIASYHAQWSRSDRPYDRNWYGADSGYNYACLKRFFEMFYQVYDARGPLTSADLDGAATLVIYDPDRRFTKDEIDLVRGFVRNGGGLWIIGDHTNVFGSASHINELCSPFGFRFRDDVLFDLDEDFHQVIDAPSPPSAAWHGMSFFKLRGPTSIEPTSLWTRPIYQVGHAKSVRAIYSVNNFYPPPHDDPKMQSGTFCVSAASRFGSGRVVAWGDSTVFSNFEVFYPGKYEYALNTMHWLNHKDAMLPAVAQRMAPILLIACVLGLLLRRPDPRICLLTLACLAGSLTAGRYASAWAAQHRTEFPKPIQPSQWVVFHADPHDKAHHLRAFITEEPYNERYEVFIQWVLRTGAFAGFHVSTPKDANGLYQHLRSSTNTRVANALIIRKPSDISQLDALAAMNSRAEDPVLLMFASSITAQQAADAIKHSGLLKTPLSLEKIAQAWPAGEVRIDDEARSVLVVAGADRFSDQAMGISEKVDPNPAQRTLFDQSFGIIDRLFARQPAK